MNELVKQRPVLKWVRSNTGPLGGICEGLAPVFGVEAWALRVIWFIAFLWFGSGLLLYILLWISLPRVDNLDHAYDRRVLGVCARIASRGRIEVGLVRFLAVLALMGTVGLVLIGYFACYFLMPKDPINIDFNGSF